MTRRQAGDGTGGDRAAGGNAPDARGTAPGRDAGDAGGVPGGTDGAGGDFERGMHARRDVLGAQHVDRSLKQVTDFSRPIQELVTRYCWGAVWTRPGLDRRTRSLLNLGMLTALGRMHELSVHVRGALNNGCTENEIQEALLQTAVYCGAPAALESFRVAERVLREHAEQQAGDLPDGRTA